jgi:hypothetical protein
LDDAVEFVEFWEGEDERDVEDFGADGGISERYALDGVVWFRGVAAAAYLRP